MSPIWTGLAQPVRSRVARLGCFLAVLPVVGLWLYPASVTAQVSHAHRFRAASVTAGGFRLTLFVPDRTFPQDALVRVWARVENVTRSTRYEYGYGPMVPGRYLPQPEVFATRRGHDQLPDSLENWFPQSGPVPRAIAVPARSVRNVPELVVLRGSYVDLRLDLATGSTAMTSSGSIPTPRLHVRLTARDVAGVLSRNIAGEPVIDAGSVQPGLGTALAEWSVFCSDGHLSNIFSWVPVTSPLFPDCQATEWHEVAGRLNHSVTEVDWGSH